MWACVGVEAAGYPATTLRPKQKDNYLRIAARTSFTSSPILVLNVCIFVRTLFDFEPWWEQIERKVLACSELAAATTGARAAAKRAKNAYKRLVDVSAVVM